MIKNLNRKSLPLSCMYETVELSNSCEAVLSDEVAKYEDLMDKAAEDNGFKTYKEIFKAIAQASVLPLVVQEATISAVESLKQKNLKAKNWLIKRLRDGISKEKRFV